MKLTKTGGGDTPVKPGKLYRCRDGEVVASHPFLGGGWAVTAGGIRYDETGKFYNGLDTHPLDLLEELYDHDVLVVWMDLDDAVRRTRVKVDDPVPATELQWITRANEAEDGVISEHRHLWLCHVITIIPYPEKFYA